MYPHYSAKHTNKQTKRSIARFRIAYACILGKVIIMFHLISLSWQTGSVLSFLVLCYTSPSPFPQNKQTNNIKKTNRSTNRLYPAYSERLHFLTVCPDWLAQSPWPLLLTMSSSQHSALFRMKGDYCYTFCLLLSSKLSSLQQQLQGVPCSQQRYSAQA